MEYIAVESSQIAAVGFGDGLYGPETLGLKFPPNKKQLADGKPGSEYHYGNVTARIHQALMAAPSIGSYFGQNIKAHPDLYPYTKVEAEHLPGIKGAIASFMEDHGVKEIRAGNTVIRQVEVDPPHQGSKQTFIHLSEVALYTDPVKQITGTLIPASSWDSPFIRVKVTCPPLPRWP